MWTVDPGTLADSALDACLAMLGQDERAKMARFRASADRRGYLVAHALARAALSWCAPAVAPAEWAFRRNPHGRPEVAGPPCAHPLRFNLSHTDGLVACLVAHEVDCGIDIESVDRRASLDALIRRVLSPGERAQLDALPAERRREHFFRLWTLKEAYVKARGIGLSLPLAACVFDLDGGAIRLSPGPGLEDDPAHWQFEQWAVGRRHVLAIALRRAGTCERRIVRHATLPASVPPGAGTPMGNAQTSGNIAHSRKKP